MKAQQRASVALAAVLALGVCGVLFALPAPEYQVDLAQINNVTATLAADFDRLRTGERPLPESDLDYAVIDAEGTLLQATRQGLSEDVYAALRHGDRVMDITRDGRILGKAIFYNDAQSQWSDYRGRLQMLVVAVLCAMAAVCGVFFFVVNKEVLRPFHNMRAFAQRVAAGELDAPLAMDRRNAFGAFTESFDLMRDELRRARENEQAAERSKRELVASLSHDIQTPLASIRAVVELMEASKDTPQREKLAIIQEKTGQIQSLVADLFHATLEELDSLSVTPTAFPSDRLAVVVAKSDYQGMVRMGEVPDCLIRADPVRLAQVMDNIITNSYKYAGTEIDVSAEMDTDGLTVTIRDYGSGAAPDELSRLCTKYFRGASAEGKNGYGLGLYIAHHLTERMGGHLECENANPGFAVHIRLPFDA